MKDTPKIKAILFDASGVVRRPTVRWRSERDRAENVDAAKPAGLAAAVYSGESGAEVLQAILSEHGVSAAASQTAQVNGGGTHGES